MIVCIIPARGGSKGIPRKNLLPLGGMPLLARSIQHANGSSRVDGVWVTTDDSEIAELATSCRANVIARPPELATDFASSEAALLHALDAIEAEVLPRRVDLVVFLQATSPLRRWNDIDNAISILEARECDSVFSARLVEGYTWRENGTLIASYHKRRPRQEEKVTTLEENGSIYVFKPQVLYTHNNRLGGKVGAYIMHPLDSFQLDERQDIPVLEALCRVRNGHENP